MTALLFGLGMLVLGLIFGGVLESVAQQARAKKASAVPEACGIAVLRYSAKPGDTLFLIPSRPIAPDMRRALLDQLREARTLKGVECVVLPSDFRVQAKA